MAVRAFIVILLCISQAALAAGGPPWRTDDPEPVEFGHWELYIASQGSYSQDETAFTAPHVELNYGLVPDVQIHLIAPFEYVRPAGERAQYGYADMEVGAKVRFLQESEYSPQAGTFPLVVLPTGSAKTQDARHVQVFLPLWFQKSWGPWKSYGGGYWAHPGDDKKNTWFFGWQVQRDLAAYLTLGAEIFRETRNAAGDEGNTGYSLGAVINVSDAHHVLLSAGRNISGPGAAALYLGYQLTFEP